LLASSAFAAEPPLELDSRAGVDTRGASFDADGTLKGSYFAAAPWAFVPLAHGLWASVSAPVAYVSSVLGNVTGLADLGTAIGYRALQRDWLALDVSLAESWPLGDPHQGLGTAQLTLAPTVAAQARYGFGFARASAAVRWAIPWGVHGQHDHLCMVAPFDTLDVPMGFEGGAQLNRFLAVFARVEPTITVIASPVWPVGTRVYGGGGVRVQAGAFIGEASGLAPLSSNRYEDWQARLSVGARF